MRHVLVVVAVLAALVGCSGKRPQVPADQLWTEGNDAMKDDAYEIAIDKYKALLDQYPFDPNAEEAELKIAQAYYFSERYPEAIASFADFERMHPTSPNLAELEYRRGMAYVAQQSTTDRDQQPVTQALTSFQNIVDRYPGTPWAERAALRVRECREALAAHEAGIADFYLGRGALLAAESRLRGLVMDFTDTDATARALHQFAGAYTARQEPEESALALATLVYHHPNGPLATEAREQLQRKEPVPPGQDPAPSLVAKLDSMRTEEHRLLVPRPVSAYPDSPSAGPSPGY
jgi:outer membrane protein assembly factor BamD